MFTLPLAVIGLVFCVGAYVLIRRYRHGGLGGGSAVLSAPQTASSIGSGRVFTEEEVSSHNSQADVWLIIKGKVYDFTDYLALHPGGEALLRNAGRDSTKGFSGSQHPARVWDMFDAHGELSDESNHVCLTKIDEFYIGDLAPPEISDKKGD
ncbi:cytochrome b5-like protein [Gracilaria domingensis]|nr:cytochrome b5-like protein [Gracilaria domingensis]